MKRIIVILLIALLIPQNPVSDQGLDQIVGPDEVISISGVSSYGVGVNTIASYQWSVPQEILDVNPGLDLTSSDLTFTTPDVSSSTIYSITLQVTDDQGNASQEYDASDLLITEFCEVGTGNSTANRYLEIYNGTGSTISSDDWQNYEIWIAKASGGLGGDFMNPDQDFWGKLFFHRSPTDDDADHDIDLDDITIIYPDDLEDGEILFLIKEVAAADADLTEHPNEEWDLLNKAAGDDGVALVKDGVPIDTIGEGDDPGSGWEVAGVSNGTKDHILVRKSTVVSGNYLDWNTSAGTNADDSEWIVLDDEDFSEAGSHECTSCDNVIEIIVAIPPIANAGENFTTCDETVSLSGSGDSDDIDYTYTWTAPGAVPLTDTNISNPSFTSPTNLNDDTEYCFQLVVNDGYVDSVNDAEICVTVQANLCPIANSGEDKNYRVNSIASIPLSGSNSYDPNGEDEVLTYEWEQLYEASLTLDDNALESITVSGLPATLDVNPTEYWFELTVLDQGFQVSDPDTVKITLADFEPPVSPNLYAVPYSNYIKLSWDFVSEESIDPLTRYSDFEGYKLYRSEDGGSTWCSPEYIVYDFDGNAVGCQPIAQLDLTEDQDLLHCIYKEGYAGCSALRGDNINEYDPVDGWVFLGENTGLEHIYFDENVIEGKEYTYTLTAYDIGLRTYSYDYVYSEDSVSSGESYQDTGSDGCTDNFEDGLGGCVETETLDSDDPNSDNYDEFSNSDGTEGNSQYDIGEPYDDSNGNLEWDGDPIYIQETNWASSNPDQWTTEGQSIISTESGITYGYASEESQLGSFGDNNFVQSVPGGLPTDITEPSTDDADNFIVADNRNIGNGDRYFDIVDRSEIEDVLLKFEIEAEYGLNDNGTYMNSFEGNKYENPSIYVWQVNEIEGATDTYNVPITDELAASDFKLTPGWSFSEDFSTIGQILLDSGLFDEADLEQDPTEEQVLTMIEILSTEGVSFVIPNYLVEDMPITFSDEVGADENWTDLIFGTRFKFDNSYFFYESAKVGALYIPPIKEAYTVPFIEDEDSTLMRSLFISSERATEISYYNQSVFSMRPPYKYMIEFSNHAEYDISNMFVPAQPWSGSESCSDQQGLTKVPFRVKNLTTDKWVNLIHRDYGLNDGYVTDAEGNTAPDYGADGRKDCFWTRSELILLADSVSTLNFSESHPMSNTNEGSDYSYRLDLDYFMFKEFQTLDWQENIQYGTGDEVFHQSMIWEATNIIPDFIPPPTGSDENGKKGWFDCGSDLKCNQDEEGYDSGTNPDPQEDDYPLGDEADGYNDNPWAPVYPWKDGDKFYFTPIAWYADGDSWTANLSEIGFQESLDQSSLANVTVVPNPYRGGSIYNQDYEDETIYFKNLPSACMIKIYTITGKLVDQISFESSENSGSGQYPWHLRNQSGEKIAPGLYIYYIESGQYNQVGKFAIVR